MVRPSKPCDISVRVSRVGGREHLTSPQEQEREARAWAEANGLKVGEVLIDLDKSGGTLDRPGLQAALERVRAGRSGGIIVAYLSRLSRDTVQGLQVLEQITAAGGAVYAPNLPDYTTPDGKMLTTVQLAIDTGYRERKAAELETAKENAVRNGIAVNSRAAVGLRKRKDRRLEHDPRTAPIVRELFERRARGDGPTALGRFLEQHRVKTSQGSRTWSKPAVMDVIRNPVYKGVLRYGRDDRYLNADGVIGGPIVDAATWEAAQHPTAKLAPPRNVTGGYLLAGILRCAACRHCLQGTVSGRGKRVYRCTRRHAGGVCPEPAYVDAATVEDAAIAEFWRRTRNLEARGVRDDRGELAALETEYENAQRNVTQLETAEAQDALGDRYLAVFRERRQARDDAARRLGEARHAQPEQLPDLETLRDAWDRMSTQERRELLALRFHVLALSRSRRLAVYPAGADVGDLPRRGYRRNVRELVPFPDPPRGTRILAL
jgi:DNA invertase Pin-like site-specific DNA recombinase